MTTKTVKKEKKKIEINLPVYNFLDSREIRKAELNEKVFDGKVNNALLHQVVIMYQAAKRAGTASTKTRGEVSGGGKKPWKQKGTGRARAGSSRSPVWKGGGAVFGPHPRDYSYEIPKKIKKLAVKSALNIKLRDEELFLIDEIKLEQPKTKIFFSAFEKFLKTVAKIEESQPRNKGAIFVIDTIDENLKRASANVPRVVIVNADNFTAMDLLLKKNLIITENALKKVYKRIAI